MKKLLALVLALVMTLSLCVTSNAAYTDAADVDLNEAVDVMSAIGVFQGADGKFDPKANLTREQAAKLVAYLQIGDKAADALVGGGKFTDVAKDRWSAGFVDYCASIGIAAGVGDSKFDPTGSLTALQFGKMLLVCLGYDAAAEGLTGADWTINTSKLMTSAKLLKGLDTVTAYSIVTREQAAQMMLNALKAPMVEYKNRSTSISVNGADIVFGGSNASYVTATVAENSNAKNIGKGTLTNSAGYTVELGEKLYSKLVLTESANALKQPLDKWVYKNKTVGTYAQDYDKMVVVEDSGKTVYDVLTSTKYMDYDEADALKFYVIGTDTEVKMYGNGKAATWNTDTATTLKSVSLNKGDLVYVYEDSDGYPDIIVVARYTYAEIDKVATNMTTAEKDAGASYRIKLVDINGNTLATLYDKHDTSSNKLNGFNVETYVEDATLAIAYESTGKTVADSYVITAVTGKVEAAKIGANGYVTVGGTKYNYADTPAGIGTGAYNFSNEYKVFATKEGYAIAVDGVSAATLEDLYYVTAVYTDTVGGETVYYAQRVNLEGKVDTVRVELGALQKIANNATPSNAINMDNNIANGTGWAGLYTFNDNAVAANTPAVAQKADNGVLTMVVANDDTDLTANFVVTNVDSNYGGKLVRNQATITLTSGTKKYLNSATKYLAVSNVGTALEATAATGGIAVNDTGLLTYVITDDTATTTAVAVIVAKVGGLSANGISKDMVYLKGTSADQVADKKFSVTLYNTEDFEPIETTITTEDSGVNAAGFHTYTVTDGVYKLSSYTAGALTGGPYTSSDKGEGYINDLVISGVYSKDGVQLLSGTGSVTLTDALVSDKLVVIDNRTATTVSGDIYNATITSFADLKDALKYGATVIADVYFDDGVAFLAIDSVEEIVAVTDLDISDTNADGVEDTITKSNSPTYGDLLKMFGSDCDVFVNGTEVTTANVGTGLGTGTVKVVAPNGFEYYYTLV